MPKKRKSQRGGAAKLNPEEGLGKWLKAKYIIPMIVLVIIIGFIVAHFLSASPPPPPPKIYAGPKKTMRQVLVDCNINPDDINRVDANTCIQNYLQQNQEKITSYQDLYDSTFLKGLTDWIKDDETMNKLVKDEALEIERVSATKNQLIQSIQGYNVGAPILCQPNTPISECWSYEGRYEPPHHRTNVWEAESISSILENLYQCTTTKVSCDNIIEEGGLDEHGREGGTPQKDLIESAFLYEKS